MATWQRPYSSRDQQYRDRHREREKGRTHTHTGEREAENCLSSVS